MDLYRVDTRAMLSATHSLLQQLSYFSKFDYHRHVATPGDSCITSGALERMEGLLARSSERLYAPVEAVTPDPARGVASTRHTENTGEIG